MSRSGYVDWDGDNNWEIIRWRGAVQSAIRGERGQLFLRELRDALDELPEKKLAYGDLQIDGEYCAIGAVCKRRGLNLRDYDIDDDFDVLAKDLGIAEALLREIYAINDDGLECASSEDRWRFVRANVADMIRAD